MSHKFDTQSDPCHPSSKEGSYQSTAKEKVNPRYVGPFKVLEKVGEVAYKLELPEELSRVHNTFHVSNLKKCYADEPLAVPLDGLHFDDKLQFVEEPVEIMDREVKRLKRSRIPLVKVRWNSRRGPEFTWEREDQFRKKYPHLFTKTAPSSIARIEAIRLFLAYAAHKDFTFFQMDVKMAFPVEFLKRKMAPKRATRSNIAPETTNTTSVTNAQLQAMINQGVTAALATHLMQTRMASTATIQE
ncbi:hypothetical protein Tco_0731680 [Tanacetum coccineum]